MKFLLTMNMPNNDGKNPHQMTVEHASKNIEAFCEMLNDNEFITVLTWYRYKQPEGNYIWRDRGEMVINTALIGKIQEYYENKEDEYNETYRHTYSSGSQSGGTREPIRPRRGSVY